MPRIKLGAAGPEARMLSTELCFPTMSLVVVYVCCIIIFCSFQFDSESAKMKDHRHPEKNETNLGTKRTEKNASFDKTSSSWFSSVVGWLPHDCTGLGSFPASANSFFIKNQLLMFVLCNCAKKSLVENNAFINNQPR